jgi:hypothetical protein
MVFKLRELPIICAFLFLLVPVKCPACSLAGCYGHGTEVRSTFAVRVTHEGKPLAGVSVEIARFPQGNHSPVRSVVTAANGMARIENLPVGDYWLTAELLNIEAADECFHVSPSPTRKAKKKLAFEWGTDAPAVRRASGEFTDSEPGHGQSALLNQLHRIEVPISGARLKLENPFTGKVYTTVSDAEGRFAFGDVPNALYVVHLDGAPPYHKPAYESADIVVRLNRTKGPLKMIWLEHTYPGAGSCGASTSLVSVRNRVAPINSR